MSTQLEYVEQRIAEDIGFFESRRNYNRRAAFRFAVVPAALSAIATVLLGIEDKINLSWLMVPAIIATGIASVLGAWQSLFANRKLWIANNATLSELYELKWDIEYRKTDESLAVSKTEIDSFYDRLKAIHKVAENALQSAYSV